MNRKYWLSLACLIAVVIAINALSTCGSGGSSGPLPHEEKAHNEAVDAATKPDPTSSPVDDVAKQVVPEPTPTPSITEPQHTGVVPEFKPKGVQGKSE